MKKNLFISLAMLAGISLSACTFDFKYIVPTYPFGGGTDEEIDDTGIEDAGSYSIKIWCDQRIADLTSIQVNDFVASSDGKYTIDLVVDTAGEDSAASSMIENVSAGADIYVFAQDQLSRLKTAGALSTITGSMRDSVVRESDSDAVDAASLNGKLYAFPFTSDNGYFMYYDKSVLSADDVKNMEAITKKLKQTGKKMNYGVFTNGWYSASYFMATGCYSNWTIDDVTNKFVAYDDNYNSEAGKKACEGLQQLASEPESIWSTKDVTDMKKNLAVCVSGIWDYDLAYKTLGDNLGCCEMPSFTLGSGEKVHISSYLGYKLIGVKPTSDAKKLSVCKKIARWLSNKTCQLQRFNTVGWGPTNIEVSRMDVVRAHPGLAALNAQRPYAQPQKQTPSSWFSSLSSLASEVKKREKSIDTILRNYEENLESFKEE